MPGERHLRQTLLMRAAPALGIETHDRMPELGIDLVVYRHGAKSVPVLEGRYDDQLRARDYFLTEDKYATKLLLREAGFATPAGFVLADGSVRAAARGLAALGAHSVVVKPRGGMHGDAVRMGLTTADEIAAHMRAWRHRFRSWLVEEQLDGHDLRLQLVGDELVAACVREPAFVTGDGRTSLDALIEEHRARVTAANPGNRLDVDRETEDLLRAQGLELSDVPAAGRTVRLKNTANLAKGGVAVDVTDSLHPGFHEWASSVAKLFDTKILAIDAVCAAAPHDPPADGVAILEVNAAPEWVHHTFSENGTHDIATRILRYWFDL